MGNCSSARAALAGQVGAVGRVPARSRRLPRHGPQGVASPRDRFSDKTPGNRAIRHPATPCPNKACGSQAFLGRGAIL